MCNHLYTHYHFCRHIVVKAHACRAEPLSSLTVIFCPRYTYERTTVWDACPLPECQERMAGTHTAIEDDIWKIHHDILRRAEQKRAMREHLGIEDSIQALTDVIDEAHRSGLSIRDILQQPPHNQWHDHRSEPSNYGQASFPQGLQQQADQSGRSNYASARLAPPQLRQGSTPPQTPFSTHDPRGDRAQAAIRSYNQGLAIYHQRHSMTPTHTRHFAIKAESTTMPRLSHGAHASEFGTDVHYDGAQLPEQQFGLPNTTFTTSTEGHPCSARQTERGRSKLPRDLSNVELPSIVDHNLFTLDDRNDTIAVAAGVKRMRAFELTMPTKQTSQECPPLEQESSQGPYHGRNLAYPSEAYADYLARSMKGSFYGKSAGRS